MILWRYLAREILFAVGFVLLGLVALFFFIDFLNEIESVGQGGYGTVDAAFYVLLSQITNSYRIMPIAALIGAIYALAQFAANTEFTIMRVSGLSTRRAVLAVLKIATIVAVLTFAIGEYLVPVAQAYAEKMKYSRMGGHTPLVMRSGFWIKDIPLDDQGRPTGRRFVNAASVLPDGSLRDVRVYDLDAQSQLVALARAESATYDEKTGWELRHVVETRFLKTQQQHGLFAGQIMTDSMQIIHEEKRLWPARINSTTVAAASSDPAGMSLLSLWQYQQHLKHTGQQSIKHGYALWRKLSYPLVVMVMMLLALPFAYLHTRSGGISLKIFLGIMFGIGFYLIDNLTQHLGVINEWSSLVTLIPAMLTLVLATLWLQWVSRH